MILVDVPRDYTGCRGTRVWAHMVSDTDDAELHRMAARLGISRRSFQPGRFPHYDVSLTRWAQAVHLGATYVTSRKLVTAMRARRKAEEVTP